MSKKLQVLIPMGGYGTRLRPLTWSKPKPLVPLADKTILDYVLNTCESMPNHNAIPMIFSINAHIEKQIKAHIARFHPNMEIAFPIDRNMRGQSDAVWSAKELLNGPLLTIFSDTIIESDFSFLEREKADGVIWVKPVPDPRRFGVAIVDETGRIQELIEKPNDMSNNLAVVGCYYFRNAKQILSAIEEQIDQKRYLNGEFYLADAINILIKRGFRIRIENAKIWLDVGTPETLLRANRYLLEHGRDNTNELTHLDDVRVIPPVYIHPNAHVRGSVVGPHISLGENCFVEGSILKNAIIGNRTRISNSRLTDSLIGQDVTIREHSGKLCLADNSRVGV